MKKLLALSTSGHSSLLPGAGDVVGGGDVVTGVRCEDGEEGVFDGGFGHGASVGRGADSGLILR